MDWLNTFRYVGYVALLFGALCTIAIDYLKEKEEKKKEADQKVQMDELSNNVKESKMMLQPFSEMAARLFPDLDQEEALAKLKKQMDSIHQEVQTHKERVNGLTIDLEREKKIIRSFEANVKIEFTGSWKAKPYPLWYQNVKPRTFIKWADRSGKKQNLEFVIPSKIVYEEIDASTGLFNNTVSILPGHYPLGELTEVLADYDFMSFHLLLSAPENLTSPIVRINKIDVEFFINGTKRGEIHETLNFPLDLSGGLEKLTPGMQLTPFFEIQEKPVKLLKMAL